VTADAVSNALLVAGYGLAVGAAVKFVPMWRQKRVGRFLVFEAGTAAVAAGLFLRGRNKEAGLNAAAFAGLALAWVLTSRRR